MNTVKTVFCAVGLSINSVFLSFFFQGRMVVFGDTGAEIRVAQKIGDEEVSVETWRKSDWPQFCWAVRGACVHFLKV